MTFLYWGIGKAITDVFPKKILEKRIYPYYTFIYTYAERRRANENDRQNTKMLKGIKAKSLKILLPCIAIAIISIIVISYMASKKRSLSKRQKIC